MSSRSAKVTRLLQEYGRGDASVMERLAPLLYEELRKLARAYLRGERPNHTLQATALVNETFLKLLDQKEIAWEGRAHFFGAAAQEMRRLLIAYARSRGAQKRGGNPLRVSLRDADGPVAQGVDAPDLLALDAALLELAQHDARQAKVVELRYFGGLSLEETAEVLGLSVGTVKRDWMVARAWLLAKLRAGESE